MNRVDRLKKLLHNNNNNTSKTCRHGSAHQKNYSIKKYTEKLNLPLHAGFFTLDTVSQLHENTYIFCKLDAFPENKVSKIAVIDTETTGLASGSGTLIFIFGVAIADTIKNEIQLHQIFLTDPSIENEFIYSIEEVLRDCNLIICFNGKSYDIPLIKTRFAINGIDYPFDQCQVIDLLYPARRLWKNVLNNCSLQSIEQNVLHIVRKDDLPGWMAPEAYFHFLRSGSMESIFRVLCHNKQDLISTLLLLYKINRLVHSIPDIDDKTLSLLLKALHEKRSLEKFSHIESRHKDFLKEHEHSDPKLTLNLANLYKKKGERQKAYELFLHLSNNHLLACPISMREVLIYEEHHLRDLNLALAHCRNFLSYAHRFNLPLKYKQDLIHREKRILRKFNNKKF